MKNIINIKGNNQAFPYIIEYVSSDAGVSDHIIMWSQYNNNIRIYDENVEYWKHINEWIKFSNSDTNDEFIPSNVNLSTLRVYIPAHSISSYTKGVRYMLTANIWINGKKVDLGSKLFGQNDTYAYENGPIKNGNNEYYTCIDFNIVDPFDIIYSDDWIDFRNNVCNEPLGTNVTVSPLYVSLYVVDKYEEHYAINDEYEGGSVCFNISSDIDFFKLNTDISLDPLGIKLSISMNRVYTDILNYFSETYGINANYDNMILDIVLKNKDSIITGPIIKWTADTHYDNIILKWYDIPNENPFKIFFNDWTTYEEGWNIVASFNIMHDDEEIFSTISNELPVTQDVFSIYTNNGSEKIIDISDMNITKYNIVNKIENKIYQIERPNESKSNILQPVFFRANETELLTLHPAVTENVSIKLDDYKSKVNSFVLQIEGCKFKPIGENRFGTIFKITANTLPAEATSGVYYVLDENFELVTTGKYNCVR